MVRVAPASKPDWRLRTALSAVLAALLLTVLAVTVTRSPARTVTAVEPNPVAADDSATTAPRTAPVADTAGGAVTRPRAGGACGLSLDGRAPASPVGSCTILEIGDSLGADIGWGLERHLPVGTGLHLVQLDQSSTGLANSSYYDWPARLAADLRLYHPQLVLVCLGGNDEQGMEVDGRAVQFPAPAWKTAYLARVRSLVSEATAGGAYVLWVGLPIMRQTSYSQGIEILNSLYRQAASHPNAAFLSIWSLFSNPRGAFQSEAAVNGTRASLRQADGIHLDFAGEDVAATYVIRQMALIYHVRLTPAYPAVITGWG